MAIELVQPELGRSGMSDNRQWPLTGREDPRRGKCPLEVAHHFPRPVLRHAAAAAGRAAPPPAGRSLPRPAAARWLRGRRRKRWDLGRIDLNEGEVPQISGAVHTPQISGYELCIPHRSQATSCDPDP